MSNKSALFHQFLRSHGIGEFSQTIPEGVGRHIRGIPSKEELVEIPHEETFPLQYDQKNEEPNEEELRSEFVKFQVENIAMFSLEYKNKNEGNEFKSHLVDVENQFQSIDDFIKFKQELNTYYQVKSREMELPCVISCCANPICLNSSVPGFRYCLNHFTNESEFNKQHILKKCSVDGCNRVCVISCDRCDYHKN